MIYLVAGLIIGFFVALPLGASAVMCINRTLNYGLLSGLLIGLGVALADLVYGTLAVFGLFAVSGETLESQPVLLLVGAFCIMFLGLRMMSKTEFVIKKNFDHETAIKDIFTGFLVTISNPLTIIAFIAALSYVNFLIEQIDYLGSSLIVLGIFIGSFIWWLILCSFSIKFKERLTPNLMRKINLISGGLIFVFGILLVISIKGI